MLTLAVYSGFKLLSSLYGYLHFKKEKKINPLINFAQLYADVLTDNLEDFNANLKKLNSEFMNQNTAFLQSCIVFPQVWDMELVSQGLTEQLQQ